MIAGLREPLMAYVWALRRGQEHPRHRGPRLGPRAVRPRAPHIFMPNHRASSTAPGDAARPRPGPVILKKSVLRIPSSAGHAFRRLRPRRPEGAEAEKRASPGGYAHAGEGLLVPDLPRGTRSLDGRLGPFRRGGFFLALESGAPIVPVTIRGTRKLMPKGQWFARRGKVEVVFHEAIPTIGITVDSMPELMEKVKRAILAADGSPERGEP